MESPSASDHVAVLTDGGQNPGLATLINSLVRNGFAGTLWIGWRGDRSDLIWNLPQRVRDQMTVRYVEVQTARPLAYFKPDFMEMIWDQAGSSAGSVIYLDCDIVVGCEWAFIHAWVSGGLALVEDLPHRTVGADHPLRQAWASLMTAAGLPPVRDVTQYFNSGFVGVPLSCRAILPVWRSLAMILEGLSGVRNPQDEPHMVRGVRVAEQPLQLSDDARAVMRLFFQEDQDALNMAVMASSVPIRPMGPEAMGFTASRKPILLHPVGPDKPWCANYIRRIVRRGEGPSFADGMWWLYSDEPIAVARGFEFARRRLSWKTAKLLTRLL